MKHQLQVLWLYNFLSFVSIFPGGFLRESFRRHRTKVSKLLWHLVCEGLSHAARPHIKGSCSFWSKSKSSSNIETTSRCSLASHFQREPQNWPRVLRFTPLLVFPGSSSVICMFYWAVLSIGRSILHLSFCIIARKTSSSCMKDDSHSRVRETTGRGGLKSKSFELPMDQYGFVCACYITRHSPGPPLQYKPPPGPTCMNGTLISSCQKCHLFFLPPAFPSHQSHFAPPREEREELRQFGLILAVSHRPTPTIHPPPEWLRLRPAIESEAGGVTLTRLSVSRCLSSRGGGEYQHRIEGDSSCSSGQKIDLLPIYSLGHHLVSSSVAPNVKNTIYNRIYEASEDPHIHPRTYFCENIERNMWKICIC